MSPIQQQSPQWRPSPTDDSAMRAQAMLECAELSFAGDVPIQNEILGTVNAEIRSYGDDD